MATSVTSHHFSLEPDIFRHYHGPNKPNRDSNRSRARRPRVDPSPHIQWTDINDILSPTELERVPESDRAALEGGTQDAPITTEDGGSKTDLEDELPTIEDTIEELLCGGAPSQEQETAATPAAEDLIGDTSTPAAVGSKDGGGGIDANGDSGQSRCTSEGEPGSKERSEAAAHHIGEEEYGGGTATDLVPFGAIINPITASGDSPRSEEKDGSASDRDSVTGIDLQYPMPRKRIRSPSSDATLTTHGTPDPNLDPLLQGPHLAKRQRSYLRTDVDSLPMHSPVPNPILSPASEAVTTAGTHMMIANKCPSTEYNSKPVTIGCESGATGSGKTADREGLDDFSDGDAADNKLLKTVEPATQPASPASPLQQLPDDRHETEDLHEHSELQDGDGGGRATYDDRRSQSRSRVRATKRQRRARRLERSARATSARSYAQRSAAAKLAHPTRHPACPTAMMKNAARAAVAIDDDGRSAQGQQHRVNEITLRPLSTGTLSLTATIQTDGDALHLSCSKPAELVESALGYAGKVEDVAFKPWASPGAWQVSGLLRLGNGSSDVPGPPGGRAPMPADGIYRTDLRERARALCRSAANGAEIANTTHGEGEAEGGENDDDDNEDDDEDATLNNRHRRGGYGGCGDDDGDHGHDRGGDRNTHTDDADDSDPDDDYCDHGPEDSTTARSTARLSRRWDPLDDQRLLAWRWEEQPWKWIFDQFPDRTEGAVRTHWHALQQRAGAEERTALEKDGLH